MYLYQLDEKSGPEINLSISGSQEQEQKAEEERIRMENILSGNPLLNLTGPAQPQANFKVKRRYRAICPEIPPLLPRVTQSENVIPATGFYFLPWILSQAIKRRIGIFMHVVIV